MSACLCVHASAVAWDGQGALIVGPSGSGKSSLALQLMGMGAVLIADDQTELSRHEGTIVARAPMSIAGLIEARGVGLLHAQVEAAPIRVVVDLEQSESKRLPDSHRVEYLGVTLTCLHKVESPAWPAAILQYLKMGRRDPN